MNYDQIRTKIQVPPELQDPFQRGILAAMKILFSDQTHGMLLDTLQNAKGSLGQIVGKAAAGTLGYVYSVAKGQLPTQLLMPLGVEVVLQIFEFLEKAGKAKPTADDFGEAMSTMTTIVVSKIKEGVGSQQPQEAPEAPQEAPGGMINQGVPA